MPEEQKRKPVATRLSPKHHPRFIAIAEEMKHTVGKLAAIILEEWIDNYDKAKTSRRPR
jgi:hypothetical protein